MARIKKQKKLDYQPNHLIFFLNAKGKNYLKLRPYWQKLKSGISLTRKDIRRIERITKKSFNEFMQSPFK